MEIHLNKSEIFWSMRLKGFERDNSYFLNKLRSLLAKMDLNGILIYNSIYQWAI